jgi:hypothetical protein
MATKMSPAIVGRGGCELNCDRTCSSPLYVPGRQEICSPLVRWLLAREQHVGSMFGGSIFYHDRPVALLSLAGATVVELVEYLDRSEALEVGERRLKLERETLSAADVFWRVSSLGSL